MSEYNFDEIYKLVNNYVNSLSNFYLDFTKDILYIEKADGIERRSVQTVLYKILLSLIKLMAPILPYTSEEVYKLLPGNKEKSIHLENFPEVEEYKDKEELKETWDLFFSIKDDVYKALEEARNEKVIGKSLEAKVFLNLLEEDKETLKEIMPNLKQLLIVSDVVITADNLTKYDYSEVSVLKFNGVRCERCWNYFNESDIIICSPLGLKLSIQTDNENKKVYDFLSAMRILIVPFYLILILVLGIILLLNNEMTKFYEKYHEEEQSGKLLVEIEG